MIRRLFPDLTSFPVVIFKIKNVSRLAGTRILVNRWVLIIVAT